MRNRWSYFLVVCFAFASSANAADFSFDGYVDARLVIPGGENSWIDGGLGKFRFGAKQPSPNFRITEAVGQVSVAITPELHGVALARVETEQRTGIDLLETYVSWRPQSEGGLRWSVKAGAFFPPVSLENDDLGWTSPYTLTPSAINSWVGSELRTIGGEGTVEWQGSLGTVSAIGSLFCCNEPAGVLIAKHGWTLDDRPTGLFERSRVPDVFRNSSSTPLQRRSGVFENIDGRIGGYGEVRWSTPDFGQVSLFYYDNNAEPDAYTSRDRSWKTRFWNVSYRGQVMGLTILSQVLSGDTAIGYAPSHITRFQSAFVLASYDIGDWRLSGRAEAFATRSSTSTQKDEDGHAFTAATSWSAKSWLRVTGELIELTSRRSDRTVFQELPNLTDTQFQLSARVFI